MKAKISILIFCMVLVTSGFSQTYGVGSVTSGAPNQIANNTDQNYLSSLTKIAQSEQIDSNSRSPLDAGVTITSNAPFNIPKKVVNNNTLKTIISDTSTSISNGSSGKLSAIGGGNCIVFNGSNKITFASTPTIPVGNSQYTIEAWVKPNTVSGANGIVGWGNWGSSNQVNALRFNGPTQLHNYWWGNDLIVNIPNALDGKWHHVVATYDGTTRSIYWDGELKGSDNRAGHNVTTSTNMNIAATNNFEYFDGAIDEVRIWSVGRTEAQIRDNMYSVIPENSAGLTAYYKFDEGTGTIAADATGNANTGTNSSATWEASTAPLPYFTENDGNWTTNATWASGQNAPTNDWASVKINDAVTLNNGEGKTVNDLIVAEGGALTIKSGASIITNGTVTNSGTFTVEKDIAASSKWHLISMPNGNTTTTSFAGYYLQEWDEPTATWQEITELDVPMSRGKGYSFFDTPDSKTTFSFSGTPNIGNVPIGITFNNIGGLNRDGANLLGNPYPSSIDWEMVSNDYGAVYYWNGAAYLAYPAGQSMPGGGTYGTGSQYVPPMQGFFIVVPDGDPNSFTFTNDMRTHSGATVYYKSTKSLPDGIMLYADNGSYQDKLLIRLNDEASENMELDRDAWKFPTSTEGLSQLWSVSPDGNLSIDVRPETETIQLGFSNNQNGNYSIAVSQLNGIAQAELEDTKLNIFHNLANGAYSFDWNTTDSEERFILHLKATGTDDMEAQAAQVYATGNSVYIRMNELDSYSEMMVYDLSGRLILAKPLAKSSLQSFELNESFGAYLVQLKGESGTKSFKIVL